MDSAADQQLLDALTAAEQELASCRTAFHQHVQDPAGTLGAALAAGTGTTTGASRNSSPISTHGRYWNSSSTAHGPARIPTCVKGLPRSTRP